MDLNSDNKKEQDSKELYTNESTVPVSSMHATTKSVAESLARIRRKLGETGETLPASITLKVLGVDQPLLFENLTQIIVGRADTSNDVQPTVDMSSLPVNAVGVSRKHLKFLFVGDKWFVEDTGSRNGSWLNNRLMTAYQRYHLQDGDQLRIGNVIFIVILNGNVDVPIAQFEEVAQTSPDIIKLTTASMNREQQGLTPNYLAEHLMPYLSNIIEMMKHVDKAKKRLRREISIVSIIYDNPSINVKLSCHNEMLNFLRKEKLMTVSSSVSLMGQSSAISDQNKTVNSEQVDKQVAELAKRFTGENFHLMTEEQEVQYQRLLFPLLKTCVTSNIWIIG